MTNDYVKLVDAVFGIKSKKLRELYSSAKWAKVYEIADYSITHEKQEQYRSTSRIVAVNQEIGNMINKTLNIENAFGCLMNQSYQGSSDELVKLLQQFLEKY